jgi:hypothetical protein
MKENIRVLLVVVLSIGVLIGSALAFRHALLTSGPEWHKKELELQAIKREIAIEKAKTELKKIREATQ